MTGCSRHSVGAGVGQAVVSCGAVGHRPFLSQVRRFKSCPWLTKDFFPNFLDGLSTRCKDHQSSGRGLNCFHLHFEAEVPWLVIRISLILRIHCNTMWLHAACLWLIARLDEMCDAPQETSEGSLRQLLKGATGYETHLTSNKLASFRLSQVSLPTEEELVACADLSNVEPPGCLKYLEGDHDEYERIARDAPVEPYTDRQHLRLVKKNLDRLHMLRGPCILGGA